MMLYPSVNELREKVDSNYTLCILAAKRARDIIDKKPVLTEVEAERPVSLATNEISEDLITYYREEEVEVEVASTDVVEAATESEVNTLAEEDAEEEDAEEAEEELTEDTEA